MSFFPHLRLTPKFVPLITVKIHKDRLLHNLKQYQARYPELDFAPVLKSNAYGHGLLTVAKILDNQHLPFFIVDSAYEALALRKAGIKSPILIIGFATVSQIKACANKNTSFTITSLDQLRHITQAVPSNIKIHLKLDTGMHRQGLLPEQLPEAIRLARNSPRIQIEGLCSHLSTPSDAKFTKDIQVNRWKNIVEQFKQNYGPIPFIHLAATDGVSFASDAGSNVARLGLGLYGLSSIPDENIILQPTLSMESIVSSVKTITTGEYVGYGNTFQAPRQTTVATIPVGYFEGIDLRLSNQGQVKIGKDFAPIVGRVSMNITTVDITDLPTVKLGDAVQIISENSPDANSIENMARQCGTIPYELLVHIPAHLRRTVT